ncbi:MAG: hypothetical protein H6919_03300 [Sphingomonadaceae bacterium]|nr:hypothetical protein [Sphingomonadaceae bacterium]
MSRIAISIGGWTLIGASALLVCACHSLRPQTAYLTIQVCLNNESQKGEFLQLMKEVAHRQKLRFIDNSAQTQRYLTGVNEDDLAVIKNIPTIHAGIEGERGLGVTASNLGLPANQVALGFTEGSNGRRARKLSDQLVEELAQRWNVETVPQGQGVFPMKSCEGEN